MGKPRCGDFDLPAGIEPPAGRGLCEMTDNISKARAKCVSEIDGVMLTDNLSIGGTSYTSRYTTQPIPCSMKMTRVTRARFLAVTLIKTLLGNGYHKGPYCLQVNGFSCPAYQSIRQRAPPVGVGSGTLTGTDRLPIPASTTNTFRPWMKCLSVIVSILGCPLTPQISVGARLCSWTTYWTIHSLV